MDARPSPEQRALAGAADRLAARLGPTTVRDLDDLERRVRLDGALTQAGWRALRTGSPTEPVASGVEAALIARALARRACDTAFIGPVLAHDLLRRAGTAGDLALAMAGDLQGVGMTTGSTVERSGLAFEVADTTAALLLTPADHGYSLVATAFGPTVTGVDLTRSVAPIVAGTPVRPVAGAAKLTRDDLIAWTALAVALTAADLVGAIRTWLAESGDTVKRSHADDSYWTMLGDWHRTLYDAGFFAVTWPKQYGGSELSPVCEVIIGEELARAGPPRNRTGAI